MVILYIDCWVTVPNCSQFSSHSILAALRGIFRWKWKSIY